MKTIMYLIWIELTKISGTLETVGKDSGNVLAIIFILLLIIDIYGWFKKENE